MLYPKYAGASIHTNTSGAAFIGLSEDDLVKIEQEMKNNYLNFENESYPLATEQVKVA